MSSCQFLKLSLPLFPLLLAGRVVFTLDKLHVLGLPSLGGLNVLGLRLLILLLVAVLVLVLVLFIVLRAGFLLSLGIDYFCFIHYRLDLFSWEGV